MERADTLASDVAAPPRRRRQQVGHDRLDRGVGMGELPRLLAHLGEQAVDRRRRHRPDRGPVESRQQCAGGSGCARELTRGNRVRQRRTRHAARPQHPADRVRGERLGDTKRLPRSRHGPQGAVPCGDSVDRAGTEMLGERGRSTGLGTLDAKGGARLRLVADHGDAQPGPRPESRADRRRDDAAARGARRAGPATREAAGPRGTATRPGRARPGGRCAPHGRAARSWRHAASLVARSGNPFRYSCTDEPPCSATTYVAQPSAARRLRAVRVA